MIFPSIGYAYIEDPYMSLLYEVLESITTALMFTSMMSYAAELSPIHSTVTTVQGLIGAIYWGMGRGAGTFIGGFVISWFDEQSADDTYGTRETFKIFAIAAAVTGIVYFLFNILYIKRRQQRPNKTEIPSSQMPPPPTAFVISHQKSLRAVHE